MIEKGHVCFARYIAPGSTTTRILPVRSTDSLPPRNHLHRGVVGLIPWDRGCNTPGFWTPISDICSLWSPFNMESVGSAVIAGYVLKYPLLILIRITTAIFIVPSRGFVLLIGFYLLSAPSISGPPPHNDDYFR